MTSMEALDELWDSVRNVGIREINDYSNVTYDLNLLEVLKNMLDNNTLYRVFPHEMAEKFEKFLKSDEKVKEWLGND